MHYVPLKFLRMSKQIRLPGVTGAGGGGGEGIAPGLLGLGGVLTPGMKPAGEPGGGLREAEVAPPAVEAPVAEPLLPGVVPVPEPAPPEVLPAVVPPEEPPAVPGEVPIPRDWLMDPGLNAMQPGSL